MHLEFGVEDLAFKLQLVLFNYRLAPNSFGDLGLENIGNSWISAEVDAQQTFGARQRRSNLPEHALSQLSLRQVQVKQVFVMLDELAQIGEHLFVVLKQGVLLFFLLAELGKHVSGYLVFIFAHKRSVSLHFVVGRNAFQ